MTHPLLARARALLDVDPAGAAAMARRAVSASPTAAARLLLGAALRRAGDLDGASRELTRLAAATHGSWGLQYEQGMTLGGLGRIEAAHAALAAAAALNPASSLVLHALGDVLVLLDRPAEAADLHRRPVAAGVADPRLVNAATAWLTRGDAAPLAALGLGRGDIAAVRLVADVGLRAGAVAAVATMLTRALAVTPGYLPARLALAMALSRLDRGDEALTAVDTVLAAVPGVAAVRALRATIQMQRGAVAAAVDDYTAAAGVDPVIRHSLGHALRAAGRQDAAVAAYREALELRPDYAEVYWSLANLKTRAFAPDDRAAMTALLADAGPADRVFLHFALAKADDDAGDVAAAFAHYAAGNTARRTATGHDRAAADDIVARTMATCTADFFAARTGRGHPSRAPIFVVGLPRSGSTLVEQILASHPDVDGLSELADLPRIAAGLADPYPDGLARLTAADLTQAGQAYLDRTRGRRTPGRPRFVDKFPGNFLHIGLIHLILPGATIIDVRRDPVATCFALFRQLFARGQSYADDLADLGHHYRSYVALMDQFAAALPGRVLTVSYEALVDDTEAETRRLLAHAGLPFDPACLRFFASDRPVRTASSEQVRQPIHRRGIDDWRRYERWLDPLLDALGPLAPPQPRAMPIFDAPIL